MFFVSVMASLQYSVPVHDTVPRWNTELSSGMPNVGASARNASSFASGMLGTRMFCIALSVTVPSPWRSASAATWRSCSVESSPEPTEKPAKCIPGCCCGWTPRWSRYAPSGGVSGAAGASV